MSEIIIQVPSRALGRNVNITVVLPDPPAEPLATPLPAASRPAGAAISTTAGIPAAAPPPRACYLLHGISGNHRTWVENLALYRFANRYHLAFICPSLERSFGLNWVHGYAWDEFLTEELPTLVNQYLRLDQTAAVICGISMGGYAAFHAALTHPRRYRAAISLSGVLDMAASYNRPRRQELYSGAFATGDIAGTDVDLLTLATELAANTPADLALWCGCGSDDHVYPQTERFLAHCEPLNLEVAAHITAGDHDWKFWSPAFGAALKWLANLD